MVIKKLENILSDLNFAFEENALYRVQGLTIYKVAQIIEHPPYLISLSINRICQKKFNNYVNDFRIKEIINHLKNEDCKKYTLEGLAKKAGFSSSSSFYEAFKKRNNCTPLEFQKSLVKNKYRYEA